MFALLTFETAGVMLAELGSGPTRNCICLRLRGEVRAVSRTALWDSEVGETAQTRGVCARGECLQYLAVYSSVSAAPGVLLSVWAKWGLTESFHVSASGPARRALTHSHKHTLTPTILLLFTTAAHTHI